MTWVDSLIGIVVMGFFLFMLYSNPGVKEPLDKLIQGIIELIKRIFRGRGGGDEGGDYYNPNDTIYMPYDQYRR